MRVVAESLLRLYKSRRISKGILKERVAKGTITQEEYNEIIKEVDGN